jgi:hypothetical protein
LNDHVELYDLEADVGEQHDLSATLPEVRRDLMAALLKSPGVDDVLNAEYKKR